MFLCYNASIKKKGTIFEMKNVIEVKNLTKEYKELKAIDDLSFEVHEGEILGLLRTKW